MRRFGDPFMRFTMRLMLAGVIAIPAPTRAAGQAPASRAPAAHREEDVRYLSGDLTLAALLMIPGGDTRFPAAVIIQGSGDSDRGNWWARAIALELVRNDLVVLLTDKRGTGASGGDWRRADFDDLANDALAGMRYLAGRSQVDPARIGIVGLSQGGWVAPIVAAADSHVAFVVNVSGAAVTFLEQSHLEMANTTRQAGLPEDAVREVLALNHAAERFLTTGDWERYASRRERGLHSSWREIAEGYPGSRDAAIWTFLRGVYRFDPMPYWANVAQPVLVLYGEEDEHDNVPVRESVRRLRETFEAAGKRNHRIVVIPGAGHGFLDMERHGLMEEFTTALGGWVRAHH